MEKIICKQDLKEILCDCINIKVDFRALKITRNKDSI
jgi:hypothetical protein